MYIYSICLLIAGVDQCIQKFLDVARQTECFFLQKRLQLSVQKPEQVVKEVNYYTDTCILIYLDSFEVVLVHLPSTYFPSSLLLFVYLKVI